MTGRRTLGISLGRVSIVIVIVEIVAPFVHAVAHVVKAEAVRFIDAHPQRAARLLIAPGKTFLLRRLVAPGILRAFASAARGAFPFSFGGKTKSFTEFFAQPTAVSRCLVPTDADDGLLRIGKYRVPPKGRRRSAAAGEKFSVFPVPDRKFADTEVIDPNAVARPLVLLSLLASHQEPPGGNKHESRFAGELHIGN